MPTSLDRKSVETLSKEIKSLMEDNDKIEYQILDRPSSIRAFAHYIELHPADLEHWYDMGEILIQISPVVSTLTIQRILFKNRHSGGMSKLFLLLQDFCKSNNLNKIVVQSVLTLDIASWCLKHGFEPDRKTGIEIEMSNWDKTESRLAFTGDYVFHIEGRDVL